jgi:hypothetical protein
MSKRSKYDLSDFIKDSKILLISDFEGTTPTTHFDKFASYCIEEKVIFLGDVFDNTAQTVKQCDKDRCEDPDDDVGNCVNVNNYCSLKTIKLLVDNEERCKYVVGNRDINKIKLIPFFSFTTGEEWWNDGKSYHEIVNNLLSSLNDIEDPWLIKEDDKKYFRPFWNNSKLEYNERWVQNKVLTERGWETNNKPLSDIMSRFEWIFGKDPDVGTMSALVTLKCMPDELCSHIEDYGDFKGFFEKITEGKEDTTEFKKKVRVALTITIFMRMLSNTKVTQIPSDDIRKEKWTLETLDGYLHHYLINAAPAYFATSNDNNLLFLFSHGGITHQFLQAEGEKGIDDIEKLTKDEWEGILSGTPAEAPVKKGGSKNDIKRNYIQICITNYNRKYFDLLKDFFKMETIKIPNEVLFYKNMLSLLKLSAGSVSGVTDYYPNQVKEPSDAVLDDFFNGKIYNVFGHASASVGYSFGKARNKKDGTFSKDKKTFFLNTDYSTTLFKDNLICKTPASDDSQYNQNYLICILDLTNSQDVKLTIEGTLILKNIVIYYDVFDKTIDETIKKQEKPMLFVPTGTEQTEPPVTLEFDKNQNLLKLIEEVDDLNKTEICKFNGIASYNDSLYYVFSNMFVKGVKKYSTVLVNFTDKSVQALNDIEGGRKRNKRTRKHRSTKRSKKGKGKNKKSKKRSKKTKRNNKL